MKKIFMALCMVAFAIVGCGDDESWSPSARTNDDSSEETSSSSEKAKSSSSDTQSEVKQSSSSEKTGKSSSSTDDASSSSVKSESSSSDENLQSSSSSSTDVRSSSSEAESSSSSVSELSSSSLNDFDWNLPKEAYLNPDIDYGTVTDERDGKVYKTVTIGNQVWMAENLNYYDATDLSVKEKSWCFGKKDNKDSTTCDMAGRLYTWAAAVGKSADECGYGYTCSLGSGDIRGICPKGWHLPTQAEWNTLFTAVGGSSTAGTKLKSTSGWNGGGNGTDAYSFSALPAGFRHNYGNFSYDGYYAYFWSSSEDDGDGAYGMFLDYNDDYGYLNYYYKYYGFSVRCLKD